MFHWLFLLCEPNTLTHELRDVEMRKNKKKKKKRHEFYQIVFKWKIVRERWNICYRWISSDKEINLEAFDGMKCLGFFFFFGSSLRVAIIIVVVVSILGNVYRFIVCRRRWKWAAILMVCLTYLTLSGELLLWIILYKIAASIIIQYVHSADKGSESCHHFKFIEWIFI